MNRLGASLGALFVVVMSCTPPASESALVTAPTTPPTTAAMSSDAGVTPSIAAGGEQAPLPEYLRRMEKLDEHYDRPADRSKLVKGPQEDVEVLRTYARAAEKGPLTGPAGERLTILTKKKTYAVGEEIRVLHVHEVTRAGKEVFVMGPKGIFGEYVDARMVSTLAAAPADSYDGAVLQSPEVDHNYESSGYKLPAGRHVLQWKFKTLSGTYLESNVVTIDVR